MTPACAKACPTDAIQFGDIDDLRARASARVEELHERGVEEAYLYGADAASQPGTDGLNAFFLLVDEPEVYNLPPDPVSPTKTVGEGWRSLAVAAAGLAVAAAGGRVRRTGVDDRSGPDVPRTTGPEGAGVDLVCSRLLLRRWSGGRGGDTGRSGPIAGERTSKTSSPAVEGCLRGIAVGGRAPRHRSRSSGAFPQHAARLPSDLRAEHGVLGSCGAWLEPARPPSLACRGERMDLRTLPGRRPD